MDGNKLSGNIPSELGSCSLLREIRLDFNSVSGAMPTEIGNLGWLGALLDYNMSAFIYVFFNRHHRHLTSIIFDCTVTFTLEGNKLTGTMPEEVCSLRGESGTLEALSATCTTDFESNTVRNQEVFGKPNEFVCRVPDCCTSCELR